MYLKQQGTSKQCWSKVDTHFSVMPIRQRLEAANKAIVFVDYCVFPAFAYAAGAPYVNEPR